MSQSRKQKILGDVKRGRRTRTIATTAIVAVVMIGVIVGLVLLTSHNSSLSNLIGQPISQVVYGQLTGVNGSTLVSVGRGQGVTPLKSESGLLLTSGGKPEVLYIGAEYCPYCAAERWALIVALSKFGNFSGLTYMLSADSPEVYPDTATFSFRSTTYASNYITFVSVETQDRNHATLQSPTSSEQNLMSQYDSSQAIPFVDIANLNVTYNGGSQFSPSILGGLNWTEIGSQLSNPSTDVAKAVDGAANNLIRAICIADGSSPSSVCRLSLNPPSMHPLNVNNASQGYSLNAIVLSDKSLEASPWKGSRSPI